MNARSLIQKKFIRIVFILVTFGLVVFFFIYYSNINTKNLNSNTVKLEESLSEIEKDNQNKPASYVTQIMKYEAELESLNNVPKSPKTIEQLSMIGWIPDWDLADGFETLKKYDFDTASPFWLLPQEDGTIKEVLNKTNPELIAYVLQNDIKLIPTIPLFDGDVFSKIFRDPLKMQKFVDEVISRVDKYDYDGVDLDFEEMKAEDKDIFFSMLESLTLKLHERNKTIAFTVLPKWGNEVTYIGHPQTRSVQDYPRISALVDEFRIMTYDYYGRNSVKAGPVAPLEWMEKVIQYTIFSGVPREKIVLGIPTYLYDWSDREIVGQVNLSSDEVGLGSLFGLEPGDAYYGTGLQKVINNYNLQSTFNAEWGEAIGRYEFEGKSRIVVFPTNESIQLRKELAASYGIKGIAYWRLGDEGELKL